MTLHLSGLSSAKSFASSSDDKNKEERRSDLILVSLVLLQQELERQVQYDFLRDLLSASLLKSPTQTNPLLIELRFQWQ